jgi:hypothetical protein
VEEAGAKGMGSAGPEGAAGVVAVAFALSPALALAVPAGALAEPPLAVLDPVTPAALETALGTGASGKGLPLTASRACPVTQTGV